VQEGGGDYAKCIKVCLEGGRCKNYIFLRTSSIGGVVRYFTKHCIQILQMLYRKIVGICTVPVKYHIMLVPSGVHNQMLDTLNCK